MSFSVQYNRCEAEALCNCIGDVEPAERGHHREYPVSWRGWASAGLRRWRRAVAVLTDSECGQRTPSPPAEHCTPPWPNGFRGGAGGDVWPNRVDFAWSQIAKPELTNVQVLSQPPFRRTQMSADRYPDRRVFAWQPRVTGARSRASALCRAASTGAAMGPWTERLR